MRIHVNLPIAGPSGSHNHATTSATCSSAPAPLTALTPNGELLLIELQGSLEIENQSAHQSQVLGTISFDPTRPDRPVLMISHHRLEGKFVNLVKPLAVLEKKQVRTTDPEEVQGVLVDVGNAKRDAEDVAVRTVKRAKRVEGEENGLGTRSSPPPPERILSPRRAKDALDFSSSPPRQTPIKRVGREPGLEGIDESSPTRSRAGAAAPAAAAKGCNGVEAGEEEDEAEAEEAQTAVYYDVVSVIKRKILFSKRPEPIVRLDPSPTAVRTAPPSA